MVRPFPHILSNTVDHWGYPSKKAALLGSLSSFAMMSYMELGDSFSNYLSKIFHQVSMKKTARVLNYYQLPHTYVSLENDLND